MKIVDCTGTERDWTWLAANYGMPVIHGAAAGPGWRLVELREVKDHPGREIRATNTLIVAALQADGRPAPDLRVAWYWPDAPEDPDAAPTNGLPPQIRPGRAVSGTTNLNGHVGFGMGGGAYYWPDQGQIGPHAVWIHGANSDVILGLGMIAATAHNHIDPVYQYTAGDSEPVIPPPEEPDHWTQLFRYLAQIVHLLEARQ
jgi:hypothetical protein